MPVVRSKLLPNWVLTLRIDSRELAAACVHALRERQAGAPAMASAS